jgi:hypothetical protein
MDGIRAERAALTGRADADRAAWEERERQARARREAKEAERQRQALADQQAQQRLQAWIEAKVAEQEQRWASSDLIAKVLNRYGRVPPVLAEECAFASAIYAPPAHWQCAIYGELILGPGVGSRFSVGQCYRVLTDHGIQHNAKDKALRAKAVVSYLRHLEGHGIVKIHLVAGSLWQTANVEVTGDVTAVEQRQREAAERLEAARRKRAQNEERLNTLRAKFQARADQVAADQVNAAIAADRARRAPRRTDQTPTSNAAAPLYTHCLRCRGVLDPSLRTTGKHLLC